MKSTVLVGLLLVKWCVFFMTYLASAQAEGIWYYLGSTTGTKESLVCSLLSASGSDVARAYEEL